MPQQPEPCRWLLPDPMSAPPGADVVGVGADLAVSTVWEAYRSGLFPMHLDPDLLAWWSPDPRGVLPLDRLRVTRSLRQSMRRYRVSVDEAFEPVMRACADRGDEPAWITEEFVATYTALHRTGWAHSIEVWDREGALAGGLYGVQIGGLFAGESMFHRQRDASKVALVALVERLRACPGPRLLDVQWATTHLASLGAIAIPRSEYLVRLREALTAPPCLP